MPHFRNFHGVYYDYHGSCGVVASQSAGFGDLYTDAARRDANYLHSAQDVALNP